jgi:PAS domain S-box-containing protein
MAEFSRLAGRIFKAVFGIYLALAVTVTIVQLCLEYVSIRNTISSDLDALGQSFGPGVAEALWAYDTPLVTSMVRGIAQTAIITGVRVENGDGVVVAEQGAVPPVDEQAGVLARNLRKEVPLSYRSPKGEKWAFGRLVLCSDHGVALERVKYSLMMILINSVIKTAGLWLILYLTITRLLSRPLIRLAKAVQRMDFQSDAEFSPEIDPARRDELGVLVKTFMELDRRLSSSRRELDAINQSLARAVDAKTGELQANALALQASLDAFNDLVARIPIGVYTYRMTAEGGLRFDYVSPRWCELMGVAAESVLKNPGAAMSHIHPDDLPSFLARNHEARATRQPFLWEGRIRPNPSEVRWLHIEARATEGGDGDIVWQGIQYDITDARTSQAALRASEEKLRSLYEMSPLGIALTDWNGRYVEFNESFRRITGYSAEELHSIDYWTLTPEQYAADEQRQIESLERTGRYGPYEKAYRRKDGVLVPLQLSGVRIQGPDGQPLIWSIVEDITARRRAEDELHRSYAELEQFAYAASHDLREPLRMISSYMSLLERRMQDRLTQDERDFLHFAKDGARRLDALILGLLDYSRVGRNRSPEQVPLAEAVRDACENLTAAVAEADARITVPPDLPTVIGDRMELMRLFQNLIGNAIKYRVPGQRPEVAIGWREDGSHWQVFVRDNGIGIDPADHERMFGIFQRLVSREQYEGTGIGLAVCRKILQHHDGSISVESALDQGACFTVTLPKPRDGGAGI